MSIVNKKSIFLILALLFAIFSIPIIGTQYEGFTTLTPGLFPSSVDVPLLHEYPLKQNMGVSANTSEIIILIILYLVHRMDNLQIM